jgi:predicted dehydrogenase
MQEKLRFGVLSTAKIALNKVIPAMQKGSRTTVTGIASRSLERAQRAAQSLGLGKSYGRYEDLLTDPEIDAVYIPLPNHLHVPWSIQSLRSGKHVLCEKPIGLTSDEAKLLIDEADRFPHLKVMEAFMYRHHPQWATAKRLVDEGRLGRLVTIQTFFSYFNRDGQDIRNQAEIGGGGLMDIGCYPISLSRFIFGREPVRTLGRVEFDPQFSVDRLASVILDFEDADATFACGTQTFPYQRVNLFGTDGRIEIEIPFNAPVDRPCLMWLESSAGITQIPLETSDQYTVQGDLFAKSVRENIPVPTPLSDAWGNMRVIEAVFRSAKSGRWEPI